MKLLGHALLYTQQHRVPVFPCRPRGKEPLTPKGYQDATLSPLQIRLWWDRWPQANIGMPTGAVSGYWVLDVDQPEGPDSLETLAADLDLDLANTLRSRTGGGGLQIFFEAPLEGPNPCNSAGKLGPGLDVRGDGGYVILPPSLHPSGVRYRWL